MKVGADGHADVASFYPLVCKHWYTDTSLEEEMSWLRRLLRPLTQPKEAKDGYAQSSRPVLQDMPTVKFDPSTVSKSVKANLRRDIGLLDDIQKTKAKQVYELALYSISVGRDLHLFCTGLINMNIEGMTAGWAAEIGRSLSNKAKAIIDRERQASLGITHAIWMYPNAPCMKEPFSSYPTAADIQQDSAYRAANGKRYEISKGLFVDGKWTWPGVEEGCKCAARAILPSLAK